MIRGFKDKNVCDLKETYEPVFKLPVVRSFLAIINKYDLFACQMDVKTAFLNIVLIVRIDGLVRCSHKRD